MGYSIKFPKSKQSKQLETVKIRKETPYLISNLGKDVYSFFPLANNFVNYMSIVIIALNSMAARFISIEIFKSNNVKAQEYISSIFISNVFLSEFSPGIHKEKKLFPNRIIRRVGVVAK